MIASNGRLPAPSSSRNHNHHHHHHQHHHYNHQNHAHTRHNPQYVSCNIPSTQASNSTSATNHNHQHNHQQHHHHHNSPVVAVAAAAAAAAVAATSSSTGISGGPLLGSATNLPANSLPHQLSQFCNSPQYPLLALQQNFSHLLPPNYANSNLTAPSTSSTTTNSAHPLSSSAQLNHHHHLHSNGNFHHNNHQANNYNGNNQLENNPSNHRHQRYHHHHHYHHNHHHHGHHQQHNSHNIESNCTASSAKGYFNGLSAGLGPSGCGISGKFSGDNINNNNNGNGVNYDILNTGTNSNINQHNPSHHMRQHHNWRKSRYPNDSKRVSMTSDGSPHSLLDLSAKIVAEHIPFQSIELRYEHIPEPVQRRIIYWSFPRHEDDIKMYSSLSSDTFNVNAPQATNNNNNNNNTSNNNGNSTTQSPSSNYAFAWMDHPPVQQQPPPQPLPTANLSQSSSVGTTSTVFKNNQNKQLTFHKGLKLYNEGCVHGVLQVGFNLSGLVTIKTNLTNQPVTTNSKIRGNNHSNNGNHSADVQSNNDLLGNQPLSSSNESSIYASGDPLCTKTYRVSVTFDRCKITSVSCSCELQDIFWCEHVVALTLYRIRNPDTIELRVPISETLLSLDRQQLQKLVQYIIAEHHTEVLPTAQRLLDEMRQSFSEINQIHGAPDPTAGACANDNHIWHLDEHQVNEKVQHYLNSVSGSLNSKEAAKQINSLFEKIREMFRAKDSNGVRLLKLITEQFLVNATRNEKSRPLWDQLVSLWVVVMLNPDLPKLDKDNFIQLLSNWSKVVKSPKEDVERRVSIKRKAAELSDDEDSNDYSPGSYCVNDSSMTYNQSNNYPAHMATHRHRGFQSTSAFPVLKPFNQLPILSSTCPCQLPHSISKKMRSSHSQQYTNEPIKNSMRMINRPSSSPSNQLAPVPQPSASNENRPIAPLEPRSIFFRALDFQDSSWDDQHLQLILKKDGPIDHDSSIKSNLVDYYGNPLWNENISQAAARVETLRTHGYREQALRLAVATVRRLKLQQDQWWHVVASDLNSEPQCFAKSFDTFNEGWIGHPLDPINILMDILLDASLKEFNVPNISNSNNNNNLCSMNSSRCACPYNQALADFTHRLLPDLASLSYQHRNDGFPILPLVNLASRRAPSSPGHTSDKTLYYHIPVPGCCQKDSYLTLAVEIALIALGQQRSIPTLATAHDRAVRQEEQLIAKLEAVDTSDPLLTDILRHQTNLLLEGGPFQNNCCGISTDSAPLHTYAKYLFDSLVSQYPQLAYKVGVYALKMPLLLEENVENFVASRTSPRTINYNHLQSEQLALAQAMLSKAKDESQQVGCLRKVYRASVKNIRNPASLLKLSKHVLKEAKPSGTTLYPALLKTSFDLGLQVLKSTLAPHTSNGKTRREAILFIVECATDIGLEAVLQVMKDSREYFSPTEALNLVVTRDNDHVNLRSQASAKLKIRENAVRELELNRRSRDLVLECANRDPTNCALEALKFCETDDDSLKKALKIVIDAGNNGSMDSTQLIKVADHIHDRDMIDEAFEIAMVAVNSLSIPSNSDNSSSKKDIFSACEYAQKVNGFRTLIPKLIDNIECATVLSEIYHRFSPGNIVAPSYRNYGNDVIASYRNGLNYNKEYNDILNSLNPNIYKQRVEDARCWTLLLERTLKAFVDTTRTRLQNISPRHYGEFIEFLIKAQETFVKAADGPQQFKDLISEIMKSYRTKKKLMEKLKEKFEKFYSIKAGM